MTPHGSIPWGFAPSPPVGTPRPYEVDVHWIQATPLDEKAGWTWAIQVNGTPIALEVARRWDTPLEAFWSAKEWAKHHDDLGYDLRPSWWEVVNG